MIRLQSEARAEERYRVSKPATTVYGETLGHYERLKGQVVHLREEPHLRCQHCGARGGVWMDSKDRWSVHGETCR